MGIADLREQLKDLEGAVGLVMNYEPGTGNQLLTFGERVVCVGPIATIAEIRAAHAEAFKT